jgi:hypothetical protein
MGAVVRLSGRDLCQVSRRAGSESNAERAAFVAHINLGGAVPVGGRDLGREEVAPATF